MGQTVFDKIISIIM